MLRGTADANIGFDELCGVLRHLGFDERIRGSHHIFSRSGVAEILNLQPKGGKAKAYQVRQVREVVVNYGLAGEPEEESAQEANPPSGSSGGEGKTEVEGGNHDGTDPV